MLMALGHSNFFSKTCSCSSLVLGIPDYPAPRPGRCESIHLGQEHGQCTPELQPSVCACTGISLSLLAHLLHASLETQREVNGTECGESGTTLPLSLLRLRLSGTVAIPAPRPKRLYAVRANAPVLTRRYIDPPAAFLARNCHLQEMNTRHSSL